MFGDSRIERPGFLKQRPIDYPKIPAKLPKPSKKERQKLKASSNFLDRIDADYRLYEKTQASREEQWHDAVKAFEANPDFYNAWQWLQRHPLFYWFMTQEGTDRFHERWLIDDRGMLDGGLEFTVHRVDPETKAVSDDPARNTQVEFWVEVHPTKWKEGNHDRFHDTDLDSGGLTYEEAVIKVAKKIHKRYGNGRRIFDEQVGAQR